MTANTFAEMQKRRGGYQEAYCSTWNIGLNIIHRPLFHVEQFANKF
jgi:hypothetical protein